MKTLRKIRSELQDIMPCKVYVTENVGEKKRSCVLWKGAQLWGLGRGWELMSRKGPKGGLEMLDFFDC